MNMAFEAGPRLTIILIFIIITDEVLAYSKLFNSKWRLEGVEWQMEDDVAEAML